MDEFQIEVIKTALRKMFRPDRYFDVCVVKECLSIAKIPDPPGLKDLSPLHCIHWSDMTPDFREKVAERTMMLFTEEGRFDIGEIMPDLALSPPKDEERGFLRFLMKGADA